jgi:hypothetical protein
MVTGRYSQKLSSGPNAAQVLSFTWKPVVVSSSLSSPHLSRLRILKRSLHVAKQEDTGMRRPVLRYPVRDGRTRSL